MVGSDCVEFRSFLRRKLNCGMVGSVFPLMLWVGAGCEDDPVESVMLIELYKLFRLKYMVYL